MRCNSCSFEEGFCITTNYILQLNVHYNINCAQYKYKFDCIQFNMSKAQRKTRKKVPTYKIFKNEEQIYQEEERKISTPQMRILEAKNILLGQQLPNKFKFRQKEVNEIQDTIKNLLNSKKANTCKIMMITGSPGAGKTMSVNHVLNKLEKQQYKVIALNSTMIKKKKDVQTILATELLGMQEIDEKNLTTFKITSELEKQIAKKCILYIEEVQLFFNSHVQFLSEDFFDLFSNKNLKILLLGISNTIDALQKYGAKLKIQIDQVVNIVFNPYTIDQLKQIMADKLQVVQKVTGIQIKISQGLLKYIANKINQMKKGDMRMAFQFLKALSNQIFMQDKKKETQQQINISIEMVKTIFNNLNTAKSRIIPVMPFQQQIVLIAMYNFFLQSDQISATEEQVKAKVKQMCSCLGLDPIKNMTEQLSNLQVYNMIIIKPKNQGKGIKHTRLLLNIQKDEIKYCFEDHPLLGKLV